MHGGATYDGDNPLLPGNRPTDTRHTHICGVPGPTPSTQTTCGMPTTCLTGLWMAGPIIQDGNGTTFFDLDDTTDPNPNGNGDLKMVPMLEIRIDGQKTNLPSQSILSNYGIFTNTVSGDGSKLAAYVPPADRQYRPGRRTGCVYAKMLYLPGADWGNAQQIRMVWVDSGSHRHLPGVHRWHLLQLRHQQQTSTHLHIQ